MSAHELARRRALLAEVVGAWDQLRREGLGSVPARVRSATAMEACHQAGVEAEEVAAIIGVDPELARYLSRAEPRPKGAPLVIGGPGGVVIPRRPNRRVEG